MKKKIGNNCKMNFKLTIVVLFVFLCTLSVAHVLNRFRKRTPVARNRFNELYLMQRDEIENDINSWNSRDGSNVWEHSGLFEGDIMMYDNDPPRGKNGLIDAAARWKGATVPYHIDDSFSNEEVLMILNAMQEYHNRTCIRFRPYEMTDQNWIDIKPDYSGCWSSVGMKMQGQIVNLGSAKCLRHGVIVHELMHAIGFYHQQSSSERDDFIKINWENIRRGREHNFNKYNETVVSNFNASYDYTSIMHYSSKAFTSNGEDTIIPLQEISAPLGQRLGLSDIDVEKVNSMYSESCNNGTSDVVQMHEIQQELLQEAVPPRPNTETFISSIIQWIGDFISLNLLKIGLLK